MTGFHHPTTTGAAPPAVGLPAAPGVPNGLHATPFRVRATLSSFLGIGTAVRILPRAQPISLDAASFAALGVEAELRRFESGFEALVVHLAALRIAPGVDESRKRLLDTWRTVLEDRAAVVAPIRTAISSGTRSEDAVETTFQRLLERLPVNAVTARYRQDIHDLSVLLAQTISDGTVPQRLTIPANAVIVAESLSIADMFQIDLSRCSGIVVGKGAMNSHQAQVARKHDIPMIVIEREHLAAIQPGDMLIVNGPGRRLIIQPNTHQMGQARKLLLDKEVAGRSPLRSTPSRTLDGAEISFLGNVGALDDLQVMREESLRFGIGLVRTELFFIGAGRELQEEEQVSVYREIVKQNGGGRTTFRTFDFAPDKQPPWQRATGIASAAGDIGFQGVRFALAHQDEFRTHVRAILRAGASGPIQIMFPFITDGRDMRQCRDIVREEQSRLQTDGIPHANDVPIGAMIETAGAVRMVDAIARYADFLSIGTGDLVRSILMIGREEELPNRLPAPYHPAVLKALCDITRFASAARERYLKPLPVSVCGDAAGDPTLTPMLLGAGVRVFSVDASHASRVNHQVGRFTIPQCERLVDAMSSLDDDTQANRVLRVFHRHPKNWERVLRWIDRERERAR